MTPAALRGWIASALVPRSETAARLGEITLAPHQIEGAARVSRIITQHGGALLADEVGLGKTFTALAVARGARHLVVVAPAVLREMWLRAAERAGRDVTVLSYDRLSRRVPPMATDFVIADEAHHVRNPATRRYRALAQLAAGAPLLLLSATPVHNREQELRALLALFLGRRAHTLPVSTLAECVVRRTMFELAEGPGLPPVRVRPALPIAHDTNMLDALAAMPPPLPPSDGGAARALLSLLLVRLWCSSNAAVATALRRLLGRAAALTAALHAGRHPTRGELGAWTVDAGGVQLAFPTLVSDHAVAGGGAAPLLATLDAHVAGVRRALTQIVRDADGERAAHLERLLCEDPERTIVAFTQYEETARELFRRLRHLPHVALLTARGARTVAGPVPRTDVLDAMRTSTRRRRQAFEPRGRRREVRFAVRLLIATDLLSEGVDLSAASAIVHVDLPWTPARVRQRVGRLRRPTSSHAEIEAYAFELPAPAIRVVDVVRTLQEKARTSARLFAMGDLADGLPWRAEEVTTARSSSEARESVNAGLVAWRDDGAAYDRGDCADAERAMRVRVAHMCLADADMPWLALALVDDGTSPRLLVVGPDGVGASDEDLAAALPHLGGDLSPPRGAPLADVIDHALELIDAWAEHATGRRLAGTDANSAQGSMPGPGGIVPIQRALLREIAALLRSLPRAERVQLAQEAAAARRGVLSCVGAAAEAALERGLETLRRVDDGAPMGGAAAARRARLVALADTAAQAARASPRAAREPQGEGEEAVRLLALLIAHRR